jgi:hypothetical protein
LDGGVAVRERGRWTHDRSATSEDLVVFLIGMHVNKPWRIGTVLWVVGAMPRMLTELGRERERGLLGARLLLGWGGPALVQYWRDVDSLYAYASARDGEHRPAWAEYNRRARASGGAVGVWHETYPVRGAETVYVDVPALGLDAAVGRVPVGRPLDRARARLEQAG